MKVLAVLTIAASLVLACGPVQAGRHRVVPCSFPNGWNPEDYHRQVQGDPPDERHQCTVDAQGRILDSHGRQTN